MAPFCSAFPYKKNCGIRTLPSGPGWGQSKGSLRAGGLPPLSWARTLSSRQRRQQGKRIFACTLYLNNSCKYAAAKDHEKKKNKTNLIGSISMLQFVET